MKYLMYLYAALFLIFWCFPNLKFKETINMFLIPEQIAQADEPIANLPPEPTINREIQPPSETPINNTASPTPPEKSLPPSEINRNEIPSVPPLKEVDQSLNKPPSVSNEQPIVQLPANPQAPQDNDLKSQYTVGPDDMLKIQTIQPEQLAIDATVSPDGFISFPYIGSVKVKDKTLTQIQEEITKHLANGYMKYPIVVVTLQESKSRKFFVYGEVNKPGAYPLEERMTVLRAISIAGGFTKYGSSSRVKILKSQTQGPGYETVKVDIGQVMEGSSQEDPLLSNGDIVVVSEGIF